MADALNDRGKPVKGSKVCVLGMAYKKDVDDPRESPGFELMELLLQKGAVVSYNDPHIPALPPMRHHAIRLASQPLTSEFLRPRLRRHRHRPHGVDYGSVVEHSRLVVDTRNATARLACPRCQIVKA